MRENEIEPVKTFLTNLLITEENKYFQDDKEKEFYLAHKIPFISYYFTTENEPFYILFQVNNYAIYFNDIEECFGICKIYNNKCNKAAEFFDNLAPTVRKFKESYEKNNRDWLFE